MAEQGHLMRTSRFVSPMTIVALGWLVASLASAHPPSGIAVDTKGQVFFEALTQPRQMPVFQGFREVVSEPLCRSGPRGLENRRGGDANARPRLQLPLAGARR